MAGETEGRKPRPTVLSAVVPVTSKSTMIYLLPITGTEPTIDQDSLEVPDIEIRRAGLSEANDFGLSLMNTTATHWKKVSILSLNPNVLTETRSAT